MSGSEYMTQMQMLSIENDSLRQSYKRIKEAARYLLEQVENYTTKAGSRCLLLNAANELRHAIEE